MTNPPYDLGDRTYGFRQQKCVRLQGESKELWSAPEALVFKTVAIVLQDEPHSYLS
ncbi:MAG: hypothetical protein ACSI46_14390 [Gloeotrichia echinulata DVL01]